MLKGAGAVLLEVNNGHFPCELKEEFQLQQAYPGAPNPEESKINQSRLENYFRQINHSLEGFLKENPLVLLGVQKYLSTYKDICRFSPVIIGEVTGNFDKHSPHEIAKLVWPVVEAWHKKKENMKLDMVKDAVYKNKAVSGIQEVWDVVRLGTGNELIVERDYACKAYLRNPHHNLVLAREPWETLVEIPDAIEAVIDELMEQHDTEIHFVDNGVLKDYGRIVLTTKY